MIPRLLVCLLVLLPGAALAQSLNIDLGAGGQPGTTARLLQLTALVGLLGLAPSLLVMMTAFARIVIVLALLRSAIGAPSIPPNPVLIGLALFLTLFVMEPVLLAAWGKIRLIAVARTAKHAIPRTTPREFAAAPVFARLISYTDSTASVELDLPVRDNSPLVEHWHLVVAVCDTARQTLIGFGTRQARVHAKSWSFAIALAFPLAAYLGLALVAMRVNARRLERVEADRFDTTPPLFWRFRQALNPLFIT